MAERAGGREEQQPRRVAVGGRLLSDQPGGQLVVKEIHARNYNGPPSRKRKRPDKQSGRLINNPGACASGSNRKRKRPDCLSSARIVYPTPGCLLRTAAAGTWRRACRWPRTARPG